MGVCGRLVFFLLKLGYFVFVIPCSLSIFIEKDKQCLRFYWPRFSDTVLDFLLLLCPLVLSCRLIYMYINSFWYMWCIIVCVINLNPKKKEKHTSHEFSSMTQSKRTEEVFHLYTRHPYDSDSLYTTNPLSFFIFASSNPKIHHILFLLIFESSLL